MFSVVRNVPCDASGRHSYQPCQDFSESLVRSTEACGGIGEFSATSKASSEKEKQTFLRSKNVYGELDAISQRKRRIRNRQLHPIDFGPLLGIRYSAIHLRNAHFIPIVNHAHRLAKRTNCVVNPRHRGLKTLDGKGVFLGVPDVKKLLTRTQRIPVWGMF